MNQEANRINMKQIKSFSVNFVVKKIIAFGNKSDSCSRYTYISQRTRYIPIKENTKKEKNEDITTKPINRKKIVLAHQREKRMSTQ